MAFDTSDNLSQDGSQGGIGKLLAQALGINTTPTAAPIPGADSTGTLPGQYGYGQNGSLDSSSRLNDVMGKLNSGAGTRTERAAYGAALDGMIKKDPSLMSSSDLESAMQNAGTRTAKGALGQAMAGQMIRGYNRGGKIKGPGTTTSDSIPGQVKETGDPILVSQGERILSAKQDMLLGQIAQMLGFKTVDELLASGTGEPVGPSIKGGTKAAAQGAGPQALLPEYDRVWTNGYAKDASDSFAKGEYLKGAGQAAAGLLPAASALVHDATPIGYVLDKMNSTPAQPGFMAVATDVGPGVDRKTGQSTWVDEKDTAKRNDIRQANNLPPKEFNPPGLLSAPTAPGYGPKDGPQQPNNPGANTVEAKPLDLTGRQQQYMENNNLRSFEDVGGGIVRQVGADGRKTITNVGTGDITDSGKRFVDDSASALIDQKNSTYNPARQLENMQRLRLNSDLTNPEITDPSVIARAQLGLNALNAQSNTQGNAILHAAQSGLAGAQADQQKMMTGLYGKLMDKNTPKDQQELIQKLLGHNKGAATAHVVGNGMNDMGFPNPQTLVVTDANGNVVSAIGGAAAEAATKSRQSAAQIPDVKSREIGKTYDTPKGKMIWRGNGWEPVK